MKKITGILLVLALSLLTSCGGCGGGGGGSKGSYDETNPLSPDTAAPEILEAKALSDKRINLLFSEKVNEDNIYEKQNYSLYSSKSSPAIQSIESGDKSNSIDISLNSSMENSIEYTLIAKNITDSSGNRADTLEKKFTGRGPVTVFLSGITPLSNSRTQEITVTGEDIVTYQYSMNNSGSWSQETDISQKIILSDLTEGVHEIKVCGKDSLGNIQPYSSATIGSWKTDLTPPVCSLAELPLNPTNKKEAAIRVFGDDVAAYKYNLDSQGLTESVHPSELIELSELEDGTHRIEVIASDSSGNWQDSSQAASHEWKVDTSEPAALLTGLPSETTSNTMLSASVSPDSAVKYRYSIDDGPWSDPADTDIQIKRTNLTERTHTLKVTALNEAGTWQKIENATTWEWTVDKTPPSAEIISAPSSPDASKTGTFSIGGTDVKRFIYSLDQGEWSGQYNATAPLSVENLTDGNHTIKFRGIDAAGNIQNESQSVSHTWKVDTVAPVALISNVPANLTSADSASINVSGTDVIKYRYILDSAEMSNEFSASDKISISGLTEGTHKIRVIARDSAGNWQEWTNSTTATWQVDITPPVYELKNLPAELTSERSAEINVYGNDVDYFRFRIDSGDYITRNRNEIISLVNLEEGSHSLDVIAYDAAGNHPEQPLTYTWAVDITAPTAVIEGVSGVPTSAKNASIRISGNDTATFKYKLNDESWSNETDIQETILLSDLDDGSSSGLLLAI